MSFLNALKGLSGEYEINRLVGAIGTIAYICGAHLFMFWDVIIKGRAFDVTAYCLAFPGGLGVAVASIAGAVAVKDRAVARAAITTQQQETP